MRFTAYKVTCKSCGGSDVLKITEQNQVFFTEHVPIIAARFRPDLKWGFECQCGNDSRLAYEEHDQVPVLVKNVTPMTLKEITDRLKPRNELRFSMEAA